MFLMPCGAVEEAGGTGGMWTPVVVEEHEGAGSLAGGYNPGVRSGLVGLSLCLVWWRPKTRHSAGVTKDPTSAADRWKCSARTASGWRQLKRTLASLSTVPSGDPFVTSCSWNTGFGECDCHLGRRVASPEPACRICVLRQWRRQGARTDARPPRLADLTDGANLSMTPRRLVHAVAVQSPSVLFRSALETPARLPEVSH